MESDTTGIVVRGGDYEHTLGIAGLHNGIRLGYEIMSVRATFTGMMESRRFEACEFSLANYIMLRATGHDWLKAIPVFPYRAFRHSLAVTRRESALSSLAQLAGKRVGIDDYSMTAGVWFRGLLRDEYDVDHRSITWVTGPTQRFAFPSDARIETTDADLEALTCDGAIDAWLAVSPRDAGAPPEKRRLRTVIPNPEPDEHAYFERTRIYPIHHCVVIRSDMIEREPELGGTLFRAYTGAKENAYRRKLGTTLMPWGNGHWLRTFEVFGGDPLPYGLTPTNRLIVQRLAEHLQEQGFIDSAPDVESLFVAVPTAS